MKKTTKFWAAGATALALAVGAGISVPAAHAADITGDVRVTLDFTTPNEVDVAVWAQNTSAVTAYGSATVAQTNGWVETFSEKRFAPGETWTWSASFDGYDCSDLDTTAGVAFGSSSRGGDPEWTSGVITAWDSRVTVIGCDLPPTPTPTPTVAPTATPTAAPTATPTAQPTITPTPTTAPTGGPTPTATPTATSTPTVAPSATPTATATAVPVPAGNSQAGKGSLANTGMSGAALLPIALIAAGALAAGAVILLLRRRRSV
ncbi:LPXTG cell wall anchor domain-containing protein [Microbacterium enclense]|uniref:LPXTG-motif cell wall anchor domain-containing protein n=1 Tax=Microbacterium enclense TaxID=993073 RepID=A0A1G6M5J6_9MICO|nr:LPXTG cell wall anchor domain-containing protein [Microbacterium enclense]KSU53671.1 hypothetical protein AS029_10600 [Microbacterium enclense]SDC50245.1 LPXTG-motif cell wall anchor domain-containing protein [Microbacterium enclense]